MLPLAQQAFVDTALVEAGRADATLARRLDDLRALDAAREADPTWYLSNRMLGGVCYVDRYAGDLAGVRERIPYCRELGLTTLHLMPLFAAPERNNDGGYAASSCPTADGSGRPSPRSGGTSTTRTRRSSTRWRGRCSSSRTWASRCCGLTRSRSSGRSSAPRARASRRRPACCGPSTRSAASRRRPWCSRRRRSCIPTRWWSTSRRGSASCPTTRCRWRSPGLATRDATLLSQALERRHAIDPACAWVNSVRSHDDIGWTFADEDAAELGIDAFQHRRFLNTFYAGRFPGSFARGVPFQENPRTGDARVSGTRASLAGLESGEPAAAQRILLAHAIALSTGVIPLLYLGDEVGQLNDYRYLADPDRAGDSRWVHRPPYPADRYAECSDPDTDAGTIYRGLRRLIAVRRAADELAGGALIGFRTHNRHVLGYQRPGAAGSVLVLANMSDAPQVVPAEALSAMPANAVDLITETDTTLWADLELAPLEFLWLQVQDRRP